MFNVPVPFPVSEHTLMYFVAYLHQEGLAPGTVKSYLSAVRHSQICLGFGDPGIGVMPRLEYVIKGSKRLAGSVSSRTRLPITPHILRQLKRVWMAFPDSHNASTLWAASCMCFFGFLRAGEVVVPDDTCYDSASHLSYGDVKINNRESPQFLTIQIKASKTDPFRQGVTVYIGRATEELCPVAAILNYMVRRGSTSGPFFKFSDGRLLTRERFVKAVRTALDHAGIASAHYAGHSFRIGAATTAAQCGMQDSLIKTLGRWKSSAYLVYVRTPRETLCSVARSLVTPV